MEEMKYQPLIFDARGNGDGVTSCTITGGHNGRITDYTAVVIEVRHNDIPKDKRNAIGKRTR